MAVDTRDRRFSLLGLGLAPLRVLPDPDNDVDAPDRAHFLYLYSGIALDSPPEPPEPPANAWAPSIPSIPSIAPE